MIRKMVVNPRVTNCDGKTKSIILVKMERSSHLCSSCELMKRHGELQMNNDRFPHLPALKTGTLTLPINSAPHSLTRANPGAQPPPPIL